MAVFQVLECSWNELMGKIGNAKDVDEVIAAHNVFLSNVMERALLNQESQVHLDTCLS